jgi:hypothetical protein
VSNSGSVLRLKQLKKVLVISVTDEVSNSGTVSILEQPWNIWLMSVNVEVVVNAPTFFRVIHSLNINCKVVHDERSNAGTDSNPEQASNINCASVTDEVSNKGTV